MANKAKVTKIRKRRSERLTAKELAAFKAKVTSFDTKEDAIEYFGLTRPTINNTIARGTARPSTVSIIRKKIGNAA